MKRNLVPIDGSEGAGRVDHAASRVGAALASLASCMVVIVP
jgi:hypothetical protein